MRGVGLALILVWSRRVRRRRGLSDTTGERPPRAEPRLRGPCLRRGRPVRGRSLHGQLRQDRGGRRARPCRFTLCNPDVAFPSKVAFSSFGIFPHEYIESTGGAGDLVEEPIGTGPYKLETWDRGNQIVWTAFDDYWGEPANSDTLVFRWSAEAAQRLVELQSGTVDGIDNVGTEDFETVAGRLEPPAHRARPAQRLLRRLQRRHAAVRQREGPPGDRHGHRQAADRRQLLPGRVRRRPSSSCPTAIPGPRRGLRGHDVRHRSAAKALLAEAGFPDGFDVTLSYPRRRARLPAAAGAGGHRHPGPAGRDRRAASRSTCRSRRRSSTTPTPATLPFYLLGWGADYPDATNFLDYHFGDGRVAAVRRGLPRHPRAASARRVAAHRPGRAQRALRARSPTCSPSTSRWSRSPTAARRWRTRPASRVRTPARSPTRSSSSWTAAPTVRLDAERRARSACTAPTRPTASRCGRASR